jgi:hypothetical protein
VASLLDEVTMKPIYVALEMAPFDEKGKRILLKA